MHDVKALARLGAVLAAAVLLLALEALPARAEALDDDNRLSMTLSDGTKLILIGAAGPRGRKTQDYYYLPTNLRLARTEDGGPAFLFLKFTTEKRGAPQGGLLHFLVEWGLTAEQEAEVRGRLEQDHRGAKLKGAVRMLPVTESGTFKIISATLADDELGGKVVLSGKAPLVEGGKAAAAGRLSKEGAQLLAAAFEKTSSIADVTVQLDFKYETILPAAKGTITLDWSRLEKSYDRLRAEYEKKVKTDWGGGVAIGFIPYVSMKDNTSYSYKEMRSHYDFLVENKIIDIQWEERRSDERLARVREAFFQYFVDSMAEPAGEAKEVPPASDGEKDKDPNIRFGNRYRYSRSSLSRSFRRGKQVINLTYRMAVPWEHSLVTNLRSWYGDVNSEKYISTVNLNDPFFEYRDIRFILDLDAKEMFEDAVNMVTVDVRKRRSSGHDFEESVVFDLDTVRTSGISAGLSYARGKDRNSEAYEYRVKWSLEGARTWPQSPQWERGSWAGVTLSPPVIPRTIEVEGDLDEMEASDVTRITVQIHYPSLGEEREANLHVSVVKGEPLVSKTLFMDRDAQGYAYRLIVNHKRQGKLVLPWRAQASDDYVYAGIPEDLLVEGSSTQRDAKEAAKRLRGSKDEKVLDKAFEDIGK